MSRLKNLFLLRNSLTNYFAIIVAVAVLHNITLIHNMPVPDSDGNIYYDEVVQNEANEDEHLDKNDVIIRGDAIRRFLIGRMFT